MDRILCISDIHGQYDKLVELLTLVKYDSSKDRLILLGDYIDRGSENLKTLEYIKELKEQGAIVLMGNHEQLAIGTLKELINYDVGSNVSIHVQCGGYSTYEEFIKLQHNKWVQLHDFLIKLPYYYEIDKYIFTHAGVNATIPIQQNSDEDFLWIREQFIFNPSYKDRIVVFGHTPTSNMKKYSKNNYKVWFDETYNDKIGIDCGSVFGGNLACLELPSKKTYYV